MFKLTEQDIVQNWQSDITKPMVSICCTTYNHEKYISEALDSFLMQKTSFPFEIIIRDDCSTDKTASIIREYEKKYPTLLRSIYEQENQYSKGVKALPVVMQQAKGKYFALCEGDDYWTDSEKLQIQISEMRKHPQCNLSFHPANEIVDGVFSGKIWGKHTEENKVFTDLEMIRNIGGMFCPTASVIICRKAMLPVPSFFANAPVGDDFIQFLGSLHGGALFVAKNMSIYRRGHQGSWCTMMLNQNEKTSFEKWETHFIKYIASLKEFRDFADDKYTEGINQKIAVRSFHLLSLYIKNGRFDVIDELIEPSCHFCGKFASFSHAMFCHLRKVKWLLIFSIKSPYVLQIYLRIKKIISSVSSLNR